MKEIDRQEFIDWLSTAKYDEFISHFEEIKEALVQSAHFECKDNDTWQMRRGWINCLSYLIGYKDLLIRLHTEQDEQE